MNRVERGGVGDWRKGSLARALMELHNEFPESTPPLESRLEAKRLGRSVAHLRD